MSRPAPASVTLSITSSPSPHAVLTTTRRDNGATPAIANLIREAKTYQIPGMLQIGKKYGMQTLDDAILDLVNRKMITPEDAYDRCIDKTKFRPMRKTPPEEWQ